MNLLMVWVWNDNMLKIAPMIPDEDPVEIGNLNYLNFYLDRVFPEAMAQEVQTGACNTPMLI